MPKHLVPVMSLIAAVILLVMLYFTTPAGIGPLGVLVFFTTFYVLIFGVSVGIVKLFTKLSGNRSSKRTYVYAAIIAFGPIMLLLAQSLGSMSPAMILLVLGFVLLACFWVSKK